jgi:hypothetical protein
MSNDTKTYNGGTNYETWCVHLWLSNEEGSYRYWREEAGRHLKEDREDARGNLAEQLKSELEEASPLEEASLFSDLLNAALSEVDWHEVADAFLEDLEPDGEPDGETEDKDQDTDVGENEAASLENFERAKRERAESPAGPLFELGRVVSTPGALANLSRENIENALGRHRRGDWGDIGRSDWGENEASLKEGFRLFSVYSSQKGEKFWVITEADRSSTCVLLPGEY